MRSPLVVPPGADCVSFDKAEIEGSIGARFRRVAQRFPDRPAVRDAGRVTTYAELARSSGRIARGMRERLAGMPGPVVLMCDAGAPLFAAMLGALEAGRFYVPLDPDLPRARMEAILRTLDAAAIVAGDAWVDLARRLAGPEAVLPVAELDAGPPAQGPAGGGLPDDLAYVLFTSGSTGTPKGVMQSHRNVLHNALKLARGLAIRTEDRLTLLSSPSFGASVSSIYGALLNGASVCPYALAGDGLRRLPEFLTRERITIFHSVPSVFRCFSWTLDGREDLSALRVVKLGGEAVLASDFDLYRNRFPRRCVFHVGLGATEMHVIRQWFADHDTPWPGASPLGHAVDDTEVVLLDDAGQPAQDEGEIAVVARTLAVGYWKDPEQTAAAFLPVPGRPGVRMYRTGDLGRMLPDGCLLYAGRKGSRLKIRGHRVEVGEVEDALLQIAGIREAVVDVVGRAERQWLVAWIVREGRSALTIDEIRGALSRALPAYMVPGEVVFLAGLPRTASGKVDRKALPDPDAALPPVGPAGGTGLPETNSPEQTAVAHTFAQALGRERVGLADDFFELGGDSLSAVEVLVTLSEQSGVELSAADLLEAPTPAALAARIASRGPAPPDALVRIQGADAAPVFVVPGGAGDGEDLFVARRLARLTGEDVPFYCFRSGPAPHPTVEELAARCVAQMREVAPRGPYRLVGDCVGGVLAFAMAGELARQGERVALLALLDTPFPGRGRPFHSRVLRRVPAADRFARRIAYFARRLRYHLGVLRALPRGRFAYAARMARVGAKGLEAPVSARRREALERRASYVGRLMSWKPAPLGLTIHLVESEEGRRRGFAAGWSALSTGGEIVRTPGDHAGFILEHGNLVAAALRRWVGETGPAAR